LIPLGEITWQYTVVPVDYNFRGSIKYEILDELFLNDPEDDESFSRSANLDREEWQNLQNESFLQTGYPEEIVTPSKQRGSWLVCGTLRYSDDSKNRTYGLEGAKVIAKRWFKVKTTYTNGTGYFCAGSFSSSKAKVAVKWERADWDIRDGSYGQAYTGWDEISRGGFWNKILTTSGREDWLFGGVHLAAMEYFYRYSAYGLRKPWSKNWFGDRRLHIGVKNKSGRAHVFDFNSIWWAAPIVIYKGQGSTNDRSIAVFGTTIHELAHVSQWYYTGSLTTWWLTAKRLVESWATGVEYEVVKRVYGGSTYSNNYGQTRTLASILNSPYTPIVTDMIDTYNQVGGGRPDDRVSGYSLGQLEQALPGNLQDWYKWRNNIRDRISNPTEGSQLDYLFHEYD